MVVTDDLLTFVKEQVAAGSPEKQIRKLLKKQGWDELDVDQAFEAAASYTNTEKFRQEMAESVALDKQQEQEKAHKAPAPLDEAPVEPEEIPVARTPLTDTASLEKNTPIKVPPPKKSSKNTKVIVGIILILVALIIVLVTVFVQ